jgi:hypothetical protein
LGTTQPVRIAEYVRRANADGAGGDGMLQRFGLMVWPDAPPTWKNVDRFPDSAARETVWRLFSRLAELDMNAVLKMGTKSVFDKIPSVRFSEGASDEFLQWRTDLENRLRAGEMSPALEGHVAKYRKLVPALALINHLADCPDGEVSEAALLKALALTEYAESHAKRIYGGGNAVEVAAGQAILKHVQAGDLKDGFTARDVRRHQWAHLGDRGHVQMGLDLLVELGHLAGQEVGTCARGGRPTIAYSINPTINPARKP